MSGTTQSDVHAASAGVSNEDMQKAMAAPAPADAFSQFMLSAGKDIAMIKAALGLAEPLVNEVAGAVGMIAPKTAPVLDRIGTVEAALNGVIGALGVAFADHPTLPASLPPPVPSASTGS